VKGRLHGNMVPQDAAVSIVFLSALHFLVPGTSLRQIGCEHMVTLAFRKDRNLLRRRSLCRSSHIAAPVQRCKGFAAHVLASIIVSKNAEKSDRNDRQWGLFHGELAGIWTGVGKLS